MCAVVCPGAFLTAGTAAHAESEGITLEELVDRLAKARPRLCWTRPAALIIPLPGPR